MRGRGPLEDLQAAALQLPLEQRARLAETLIASLDEDSSLDRTWRTEIRRRIADVDAGAVTLRSADEVMADALARLRAARTTRSA